MKKPENGITLSKEVENFINERGCDYRICTSCGGPAMISLEYCGKKNSDIRVRVGENTLYVSIIQYNDGLRYIGEDMIGNGNCRF